MADYAKPLPEMQGLTKEFYDWCKQHELRFQRCKACRTWRHVPREMCASCGSFEWEWAKSSGRGQIFSWTVVERPMHPSFVEGLPYASVIVEMEEGVRLLSQVVDCSPDQLEFDAAVEVVFEDATDEVTLPRFRRVAA